jgi:PAS domain S-box-containing protein
MRSRAKKCKTKLPIPDTRDRLQLLTDSFDDVAIILVDKEGNVEDWNPGAEAIFEFKEANILGKSADAIFTPEDRADHIPEKERATALRTGRASDERWHMREDGSRFFASGVMVPLYRGAVHQGFAKIARDLTSSIEAEANRVELEMLKRLVEAQEAERTRIARDLHDTLGQQITALRLKIEALKATRSSESELVSMVDEAQAQAKQLDDEVSFMTWELRPTALDNLGLKNALGNFVKEWSKNYGIEAKFHSARLKKSRLASEIEINLYRIAQEALNNVVKHAKASKVDVMLEYGKENVVLIVEDNGAGFDVKAAERRARKANRLGLVGMRERAALLGGTLQIESARLKGTTVMARVPIPLEEEKPRGRAKK